MKELIKITRTVNGEVVSARELHGFLEVSSNFRTWIERMFDYGFEENLDYTLVSKNGRQNSKKEYALTVDCAKEISMLQRSNKGKQARKYFIQCEKNLKDLNPKTLSRKQLAYMIIEAEEKAERLQLEIDTKHKPRSQFVSKVFESEDLISMSVVAKTLQLDFGRNTLYKKLREKGILFKNSNEPKQNYVLQGYFKLKEKLITLDDGRQKVTLQTFVTQKGLAYIAKVFNVVQIPLHPVQISA